MSLDIIDALGRRALEAKDALSLSALATSARADDIEETAGKKVLTSSERGKLSGLGDAAGRNVGTTSGTVAAGDDARMVGATQKDSNLSDLASASAARTNLGLGGSATRNVGTAVGTVAAGNDSRIVGALQPANIATTPIVDEGTSNDTLMTPFLTTHAFKYRGFVSPLDFPGRAVGNDITVPFLAACAAEDVFAVMFPPGVWNIEAKATVTDRPFKISGFAEEVSQIISRDPSVCIVDFVSTTEFARYQGQEHQVVKLEVNDLTIAVASDVEAYNWLAIHPGYPSDYASLNAAQKLQIARERSAIRASWVDRVDYKSYFGSANFRVESYLPSDNFGFATYLLNANGIRSSNCTAIGDMSRRTAAGANPFRTGGALYSENGLRYPKVGHKIVGQVVGDVGVAIKMDGWTEGWDFIVPDLVNVGKCFEFNGFGDGEVNDLIPPQAGKNNPNFRVLGGHLNFRETAFDLQKIYNIQMVSPDMLKDGEGLGGVDGDYFYLRKCPTVDIAAPRMATNTRHNGKTVRGIRAVDKAFDYRIHDASIDGHYTEFANISGDGGNVSIHHNFLAGAAGRVGVRTGANIIGVADDNTFNGDWSGAQKFDVTNPAMIVRNNSPEDGELTISGVTPSVGGKNTRRFLLSNAGATDVAGFANGYDGMEIVVRAANGLSKLKASGTLTLQGGLDWTMPANSRSTFRLYNTIWQEVSRIIV